MPKHGAATLKASYKGDESYIFVSYAHKDSAPVYEILSMLQQEGYRVWCDEGIDPGTEWAENIAGKVEGCAYFIAFMTENYVASSNCQDNARDLDKQRLVVYLGERHPHVRHEYKAKPYPGDFQVVSTRMRQISTKSSFPPTGSGSARYSGITPRLTTRLREVHCASGTGATIRFSAAIWDSLETTLLLGRTIQRMSTSSTPTCCPEPMSRSSKTTKHRKDCKTL